MGSVGLTKSLFLASISVSAALFLLSSVTVAAQRTTPFAEALIDLTEAVEGIYGDEGALIATVLDRMSSALKASSPVSATVLHDALGSMPVIPLSTYREGYARMARGEFEAAIVELRRAASRDPLTADPAARSDAVQRAVASLKQGRLLDAQSLLERSDVLRDSSEARRVLGLVYWAASDYEKSVEQLEAAIRLNTGDERSRLALSRVLSSANRDADAARVLEETIRAIPDSGRAHWWLAMSYERLNRFADARAEFERAAAAAVAGQSHLYGTIGRLASGATDLDGAVDALTRATRAEPNNPTWHRLLAGALLHQDRAGDALAEFIQALLLNPGDAEANFGIGQIHLNAGRYAEAASAFRRATDSNANAIDAQYALATALTRLGNSKEAARYFERVELAQKQAMASRRRTLSIDALKEEAALKTGAGDHQAATALWRQVIQLDPQRASNHTGLAAALASAGQDDGAIVEYERAAALGAEPVVYRQLADLYARIGRAPDAARARVRYEAALQGNASRGR